MHVDQATRKAALEPLDVFIGEWSMEASFPLAAPASIAGRAVVGRAVFEWVLGGQFLAQHEEIPDPDLPESKVAVAAQAQRRRSQMTKVIFDVSMSLDGYMTASGVRPEEPMGDGGQQLHEWAFDAGDERSAKVLAEMSSSVGAGIAGRRTYDMSVPWWGPDGPSGSIRTPLFVVSHGEPEQVPDG